MSKPFFSPEQIERFERDGSEDEPITFELFKQLVAAWPNDPREPQVGRLTTLPDKMGKEMMFARWEDNGKGGFQRMAVPLEEQNGIIKDMWLQLKSEEIFPDEGEDIVSDINEQGQRFYRSDKDSNPYLK